MGRAAEGKRGPKPCQTTPSRTRKRSRFRGFGSIAERPCAWRPNGRNPALLVFLVLCETAAAHTLEIPFSSRSVDVDGKLELEHAERTENASPHQDPAGRLRVGLASDLHQRVRFQSSFTGTVGGTPRNARGAGVFDLGHTLQDISPSLDVEEAYLDVFLPSVDARIGMQKFAWGKLDGIQPNDILNPEKFYDLFLEEENDRKIGIPALSLTAYLPAPPAASALSDLRLAGVWAPIVVPFRFPDQDERWYPPLARIPPETESMGFVVMNRSNFRNGDVPSRNLSNGAGAARLSGLAGGADFSLYYYDGYDTLPSFEVDARGFVRLNPLNPQGFDIRSEVDVFPVFDRIRAAGADVAYSVFGATLRAEGAWVEGRLFPRAIRDIVESQQVGMIDPVVLASGREQRVPVTLGRVNVERDGIEWGAGGDYLWGDTFVLVQMNQTAVLRNDQDLLISDTETRFAATVRYTFLSDRAEAELIGLYGLQSVYGVAQPRFTYDVTDHLEVRVGYLVIAGHEESLVGQFRGNDEAYVRVRYFF